MPCDILTAILLLIFGNQVMMGVGIFNCHKQSGNLSFETIPVNKYTTEFTVSLCSGLRSLRLINILEFNVLILAIITFVITTTACHYHNKVRCHYHIDVKVHGKILHLEIIFQVYRMLMEQVKLILLALIWNGWVCFLQEKNHYYWKLWNWKKLIIYSPTSF